LEQLKEVWHLFILASFVDERDDDIPGPGAQNPKRIDRHTITQWKFGRDTERNTFL
jgi:hypothetical protein